MAINSRYLRKLPQQHSLRQFRGRTPIDVSRSSRSPIPSLASLAQAPVPMVQPQRVVRKPELSQPTSFSESEGGGGPGIGPGEAGTGGFSGDTSADSDPIGVDAVLGQQMGNNIAASMLGRGAKSAAMTSILGSLAKAPFSQITPIALQNFTRSMTAPVSLGNAAIGQAISGNTISGQMSSPAATGLPAPVANQTALNALENSPQTVLGHVKGFVTGDTASAASQSAIDTANMAMAEAVTGGYPSASGGDSEGVGGGEPPGPGNIGGVTGGYGYGGGEDGDIGADGGGDGGGGTLLCGELNRQGLLPNYIYQADSKYGKRLNPDVMSGYHLIARPMVSAMQKSSAFTWLIKWPVISFARQAAYREGVLSKPNRIGALIERVGIPICRLVAKSRFLTQLQWLLPNPE